MPILAVAASAEETILAAILRTRMRQNQAAAGATEEGEAGPTSDDLEAEWPTWLAHLFGHYFQRRGRTIPFAPHQIDLWEWIWSIKGYMERGEEPPPFVAIWPRNGGKSTNAELFPIAAHVTAGLRYFLYVSMTQDQADQHVATIAEHLESDTLGAIYPALGARLLSKYQHSRGWNATRLRTASGLTIDALGLDKASRGIKMGRDRPDGMVFDDLDDELDGPGAVEKKATIISRRILPAGADLVTVLVAQNLVHHQGVVARLAGIAETPADFMYQRIISGPHPALDGLLWEPRPGLAPEITAGMPRWVGQGIAECQRFVDRFGLRAFLAECQHEDVTAGGIFDHVTFRTMPWADVPWGDIVRVTCWVDPAVTATDKSDSHAICVGGLATDGTIYILYGWEQIATPEESLERAIVVAVALGAMEVGVETDQGGDTWQSVYREAARNLREGRSRVPGRHLAPDQAAPRFTEAKAGSIATSKVGRASLMLPDYDQGKIVHVVGGEAAYPHRGKIVESANVLQSALRRFPVRKPLDLTDVHFWVWNSLRNPTPYGLIAQGVSKASVTPWISGRRRDASRARPGRERPL